MILPSRPARVLLLGLLCAAQLGCPRPTRDGPPPGALPSTSPASGDLVATKLGPGDVFEVRVFQEAELSGVYRVGPEGTIDFPFCGRLDVREQTSSEVATLLRDCLAKGYLRNPQVTVVAREYNSKKIFIFGQVQKPGTFPFEDNMTIIQAITMAGGFNQFAGQNKTRVTRLGTPAAPGEKATEKQFEVPVQDIGVGKAPNFYLQPGDIVFVPESWI